MRSRIKGINQQFGSWAEFYADLYDDDSPVGYLLSTRLKRVIEMLGDVRGSRVLDAGCGPGMTSDYVLKNGSEFFGIDLSESMLKICRERSICPESMHLAIADIATLPFPDSSFDTILCLGALEYVETIKRALRELSRLLKKDGIVIISMQNPRSPYRLWDRYVYQSYIFDALRKIIKRTKMEKSIEKNYSCQEFQAMLQSKDLAIKDVVYYDFNLWLRPLDRYFPKATVSTERKLENLNKNIFRSFGTGYLIKAKKIDQRQ